jgi:hypothetical protein
MCGRLYFSDPRGDYRDMKPVLVSALLLFGIVAMHAEAGEYETKAAYLYRFAQFVEWPGSVLAPGAAIVIGVVGDDAFGRAADEAIGRKYANGHPLLIRRLRWIDAPVGCHIIYISASEAGHLRGILDATRGRSVLTVSEVETFAQRGGVIELQAVENRIEFEVNTEAAHEGHLIISSKLLQIARGLRSTTEER